ncbi:marvel domain-containing protein [Xylariaceae sp. FL0804]|nr:marvel domain-containing protein [Xylariaceae sp. FL0804]
MAYGFAPIVHIVAGIFAIIELGLTAYLASLYNGYWGFGSESPSEVNFLVFASVWSLLVLLYIGLAPLYATSLFHRLAALVLEAITALFWFAGAIALAVDVGAPRCNSTACNSAQAAVAFAFFEWALFTFLTVLDAIESMRSRRGHGGSKGPAAYPGA